jgi:hypothetical protein
MKKLFILFFSAILWTQAFSQTHLYENPDFERIAEGHEEIAIIPFNTSITLGPLQMREISADQLAQMEEAEGEDIQFAMYSWFLKRAKRGSLKVKVQSPSETNAKLKKAGLTYDTFDEYTPTELAELLGVDAVVMGSLESDKPISEGASIALGLLAGIYTNTNLVAVNLFIYNGMDGDLLINYHKAVSGSVGSSPENLVNTLMRKASRRIAYTN